MSNYLFFLFFHLIIIVFSSPSCQERKNFCSHCNFLTNLCAKCEKPGILVPDEKGGCIGAKKCFSGENFCLECDVDGKLCKNCDENYYPDENGGCTYSEGCEISYNGECLKCKDNFILIGRQNELKICRYTLIDYYKNCQEINYETGLCKVCQKDYYLTSGDYKCIKENNCKESIFGNCISCNNGYYYNKKENKCKLKDFDFIYCKQSTDGKTCDLCDDDCYLDQNGICIQTRFCSESENLKCKNCISGYYLADNFVCTTAYNCSIGDTFTSLCSICQVGYYLDTEDYQCKSNLEDGPFKYCNEVKNNICIRCDKNYFLGEDLKCSSTQYCAESENGICLTCKNGYYLGLDKKCIDVEKCIYSSYGTCMECEDGYYYNRLNKTCSEMKDQFLNCKISCSQDDKCCECKENFYLDKNDSLCYDNNIEGPFLKCSYVDILMY